MRRQGKTGSLKLLKVGRQRKGNVLLKYYTCLLLAMTPISFKPVMAWLLVLGFNFSRGGNRRNFGLLRELSQLERSVLDTHDTQEPHTNSSSQCWMLEGHESWAEIPEQIPMDRFKLQHNWGRPILFHCTHKHMQWQIAHKPHGHKPST